MDELCILILCHPFWAQVLFRALGWDGTEIGDTMMRETARKFMEHWAVLVGENAGPNDVTHIITWDDFTPGLGPHRMMAKLEALGVDFTHVILFPAGQWIVSALGSGWGYPHPIEAVYKLADRMWEFSQALYNRKRAKVLCMQVFPICPDWDTHFEGRWMSYWWSATLFNNRLQFRAQSGGVSYANPAIPYWSNLVPESPDAAAIVRDAYFEGKAPGIIIPACGHAYTSVYHCFLSGLWRVIYGKQLKCICHCRVWGACKMLEEKTRNEPSRPTQLGVGARPKIFDLKVSQENPEKLKGQGPASKRAPSFRPNWRKKFATGKRQEGVDQLATPPEKASRNAPDLVPEKPLTPPTVQDDANETVGVVSHPNLSPAQIRKIIQEKRPLGRGIGIKDWNFVQECFQKAPVAGASASISEQMLSSQEPLTCPLESEGQFDDADDQMPPLESY